jgi:hypothetical protein
VGGNINSTKRTSSSSGKAESASDSTSTAKYETGIKAIKATKAESVPESTFLVPTTVPPLPFTVARRSGIQTRKVTFEPPESHPTGLDEIDETATAAAPVSTDVFSNLTFATVPTGRLAEAELEIWHQQYAKSVKSDDAATPIHLWDGRVWSLPHCLEHVNRFSERFGQSSLDSICKLLLQRWRSNIRTSLLFYLHVQHGSHYLSNPNPSDDLRLDLVAGRECLYRAMAADWWDWTQGSWPFFWRWPMAHQREARDGYKQFIERDLPQYKRPQPFETDPTVRTAVRNKLATVRDMGCLSKGSVASLTLYFCVPKGDQDIRMVYDATKSKLNSCLWAPNFGLPTVDTLTRNNSCESWMGDLDIGEMFLNFCLHPDLQPFCGVDLKPYFLSERGPSKTLWERWVRCMMGLKSSPYFCIKALLIMLEFICGDRSVPLTHSNGNER